MPGNPSGHAFSTTLELQDIRQEDGKPDCKRSQKLIESDMNSDFRLFGEWVTVKIIDGRGERGEGWRRAGPVDMRIFHDRMCLKEWTEKHLLPRPATPLPQKKRRERLQVRRNRMCESLIQKPWEFIHLGTRNFSQSESLRILLLWKALQAVLWLTGF